MRHNTLSAWIIGLATAAALFALRCTGLDPLAGTVTQSGNGYVCGVVVDSLALVSGARVLLLSAHYDPNSGASLPDSLIDTTDESGAFRIIAPRSQRYNVEVEHRSGKNALRYGIGFATGDTQSTGLLKLAFPGSIKVIIPDSAKSGTAYVYLPGTTFFSLLHGDTALLSDVPAGSVPELIFQPAAGRDEKRVIQTNITVASGRTTTVADYSSWQYSKRLYLNTTASGADVAYTVTDFPALIRLTSDNFDFSQARPAGEDLRFAKADGTPLPFEIERWDVSSQTAEIWVKLDTVYGNDSTQSITMYWGNADAPAQSNSSAVFDTAKGFQGVWHLSETGSAIAKDATGNHYDGTPSDTAPAGAEGTIGPCRSFNGSSNYLRMNGTANSTLDFPDNGIYTVSAWVYADSLDNGYHVIAGKGNEQYFLKFKVANPTIPNSLMVWEFVDYYDKTGYNITNSLPLIPQIRTWSYIVGVRKGTQQFLYLNGALADSTPTLSSFAAPRNTGDDVTIGKFVSAPADTTGGKCPFLGKIDEVRISNAAHNADWIKLCYMNQKESDALVKW